MGAGNHGGFGNTFGSNIRNRIGHVVAETVKDLDMMLSPVHYASVVAMKYNIHLRGSGKTIEIVFNPDLNPGVFGRTRKANPFVIEIGPASLMSECELANTIAHELNHARSFIRGGNAPESRAYKSGNALADYIGGGR